MHCPQWMWMRLLDNPDYTISRLGESRGWIVFLVERKGPLPADAGSRQP